MFSLIALVLAQAPVDLCPAGWESLRDDACLLRGDRPGVVVYFHGMTAPSPRALGFELGFVSRVPRPRRMSFVSLRGTAGLCDWATEYSSWWCWPTTRNRLNVVTAIVGRVSDTLALVRQRLNRDDGLPVIAGYSNGGYLVTMLMGEASLPSAGWVVMHGGPVAGQTWSRDRERPTLLITGAGDGIQRPAMETLKSRLDEVGWSSVLVVRPGGHPPEVEDYQRLFDFASTVTSRNR
jgi:predicted esterase